MMSLPAMSLGLRFCVSRKGGSLKQTNKQTKKQTNKQKKSK